jgi:hypothetical protein
MSTTDCTAPSASHRRPHRRQCRCQHPLRHAALAMRMILSLVVRPARARWIPFLENSIASSVIHPRKRAGLTLRARLGVTSRALHARALLALAQTVLQERQCRARYHQRPRQHRNPHRVRRHAQLAPFAPAIHSRTFRVLRRVSAVFHRRHADWNSLTRHRSVEADHNALQMALLVFAIIAIAGQLLFPLHKSAEMGKNATSWILSRVQNCRIRRSPRRRCAKSHGSPSCTSASRTL